MASRTRSGAPSPQPMGYPNRRRYVPQDINWTNAPFGPDEAPEGRWGKNAAGDSYISCPDGSYHYFNADGSYYYSDGKPGVRNAPGANVYVSPRSERFYTPATEDLGEGEYFIGRNWRSGEENIYWEHKDGRVVRSFRKNVDLETEKLDWDFVATDERYRPRIVDRNGRPIGGRTRSVWVPERERGGAGSRGQGNHSNGANQQPWKDLSQVTVVEPDVVEIGNPYPNARRNAPRIEKESRCCCCM